MVDVKKATAYAMINIIQEQKTTCRVLARKAGVAHGRFNDVVSGRTKNPSIGIIYAFCLAAGMSLTEFFSRKEFGGIKEGNSDA